MNDAAKTPWHLWAIGLVSLLWNSVGAYDYTQTRMRNMEYLEGMGFTEEALAYIDNFPIWADIAWAFGVWGALAGSILLLLRNRFAVTAYALSLAGAVLSNLYPFVVEPPAIMQSSAAKVFSLVIIGIAAALLYYAHRMKAAGVLR